MGRQLPEIFDVFVFFENEIFGNTLSLRSYVSAVFRSEGGEHRREGVPSVKQFLFIFLVGGCCLENNCICFILFILGAVCIILTVLCQLSSIINIYGSMIINDIVIV